MKGKHLFFGFSAFLVLFSVGLFYAINHAYYTQEEFTNHEIGGLQVTNYAQIDADTSPIKFRACFELNDGTALYGEDEGATPLVAPYWFDCFDAKTLTEDLDAGTVNAVLYDENNPYGVSSYMIVYPDGRGFAWRQLNECGEAAFSGEDAPETCPETEAEAETENG